MVSLLFPVSRHHLKDVKPPASMRSGLFSSINNLEFKVELTRVRVSALEKEAGLLSLKSEVEELWKQSGFNCKFL